MATSRDAVEGLADDGRRMASIHPSRAADDSARQRGCRTPGGAEGMRVRVLGAVEIATAEGDPPLARWPRVRRLLAVLLVHQG